MKSCPHCGKRFNLWQRAIGEHREHLKTCGARHVEGKRDLGSLTACRGCPAGCFEDADYGEQQGGDEVDEGGK